MRTRIALVPALALALGAGCGDASGPGTAEAIELFERYGRWRERGPDSYSFEYRETCYCHPGDGVIVAHAWVEVFQGTVVGVSPIAIGTTAATGTGSPTVHAPAAYPTIDGLFERLERMLRGDLSRFDVEYDAELGYPTRGAIDLPGPQYGDHWIFEVRSFGPPRGFRVFQGHQ